MTRQYITTAAAAGAAASRSRIAFIFFALWIVTP
jgi:hypothetical protein